VVLSRIDVHTCAKRDWMSDVCSAARGVDPSPDMLARLRGRAERRGLEVNAWLTAMEAMVLPRRYRTVFLAGPTFNLLPTDDAMRSEERRGGRRVGGG